jgi:hypothetical protein
MVVNSDLILLKDNTDLPQSSIEARWCLGLTSIREWTCLVNEHIAIESEPVDGTMSHARLPIDSEVDSQRKAM